MRRIAMHMQDWVKKLDGFLTLNDRNILDYAGKISHEMAMQLVNDEYDKFHNQRLQAEAEQSDKRDFEVLAREIIEQNKDKNKRAMMRKLLCSQPCNTTPTALVSLP